MEPKCFSLQPITQIDYNTANQASVDYTPHTVPSSPYKARQRKVKVDFLFNLNLFFQTIIKGSGSCTCSSFLPHHQGFWHFGDTNLTARKEEPCFQSPASSSVTAPSRKVGLPSHGFFTGATEVGKPIPHPMGTKLSASSLHRTFKTPTLPGKNIRLLSEPQLGLPTGFLSES